MIIDDVINQIPNMMKHVRNPDVRKYMMIKNEDDFVLGWVIGRIGAMCGVVLQLSDYQELSSIVHNKMAQIRSKITNTG